VDPCQDGTAEVCPGFFKAKARWNVQAVEYSFQKWRETNRDLMDFYAHGRGLLRAKDHRWGKRYSYSFRKKN